MFSLRGCEFLLPFRERRLKSLQAVIFFPVACVGYQLMLAFQSSVKNERIKSVPITQVSSCYKCFLRVCWLVFHRFKAPSDSPSLTAIHQSYTLY